MKKTTEQRLDELEKKVELLSICTAPTQWVSRKQAAEMLNCSRYMVMEYEKSGELEATRPKGLPTQISMKSIHELSKQYGIEKSE